MRFRGDGTGDFDALHRFMLGVHVRALADEEGLVTLSLMLKARSAFHERSELTGYVQTWNMINPYQHLEIVETFG